MRTLLLLAALGGCFERGPGPAAPDGAVDAAVTDSPSPDAASPPSCPVLSAGVRRCRDLAPECQVEAPPTQEPGLHCLPEYESDPTVPCFCVGHTTADSWCIRDAGL